MTNRNLEILNNATVVINKPNKSNSNIYNATLDSSNLNDEAKIIIATQLFKEFMTKKISNLFIEKRINQNIIISQVVNNAISHIGIGIVNDKNIFKSLIVNEFYCFVLEPFINRTFESNNELSTYMNEIDNDCLYITNSIFNILNTR